MTAPQRLPLTGAPTRTSLSGHAPELARAGAGALADAVRARLRPVCPGWPPDQFAALVTDVVRFHERWDAPARRP